MTRTIIATLFVVGVAHTAAAQPAADASVSNWTECLKALTRACVLREAAKAAWAASGPSKSSTLSRIAEAQYKAGFFADAAATVDGLLQYARSIAENRERDDAFRQTVPVLAGASRFTDALEAAGAIENRYLQAEAIGDITIAEWHAGQLDDALRRVRAIEDPRSRALVMRRVAWDLRADAVGRGEDGRIVALMTDVQAIEGPPPTFGIITGIHHPSEFMPAFAIIAQAQARAGKIEDAMRTVGLAAYPLERTKAFATIAADLAQAGATASALKVARALDDSGERGTVLDAILDPRSVPERFPGDDAGRSSVKAEAPDEVAGVLPAFMDDSQRATALAIVAVAFANAGRPASAVDLAEAIGDGKPRVFAWHAIAVAQAKAGLTVQSIASFDRAVQAAMSFERHDWRLSQIAISQADAGQIDEALRVTGLIGGTPETAGYIAKVNGLNVDHERRGALRSIAKAQARAGRIAEATQNAHALVLGPEIIPPGLGVVAEALAEAGRIDEAIEAATIETNTYWRAELLARIAKARAAAGRIDDAKQVAQHVTEDRYRADALASIAAAQAKAGLKADAMATFTDALQIAQSLHYKNIAAELLIVIAARLPD